MAKEFSTKIKTEAESLLKRYPEPAAAILPVMHLAERDFGLINDEAEKMIARMCEVSQIRVHEVLTFYHMYRKKEPRGKYHIMACQNISCSLLGAEELTQTSSFDTSPRASSLTVPVEASSRGSSAYRRWSLM